MDSIQEINSRINEIEEEISLQQQQQQQEKEEEEEEEEEEEQQRQQKENQEVEEEEEEEEEKEDNSQQESESESELEEENDNKISNNDNERNKKQKKIKRKKREKGQKQKQIQTQEQNKIPQSSSSSSSTPLILVSPDISTIDNNNNNINPAKNRPLIAKTPTPKKITIQQKPISENVFSYSPPKPRKDPQQQPNEPKQVASAETQQTENKNKKNINDTPKKGDNGKIKETSKNQTTTKIYKNNELDEVSKQHINTHEEDKSDIKIKNKKKDKSQEQKREKTRNSEKIIQVQKSQIDDEQQLIQQIQAKIDKCNQVQRAQDTELIIIQTDISGAFNSARRDQILNKLQNLGMSNIGLQYNQQSFEKQDLRHYTKENALKLNIQNGIPQGNPLSPANFAILTADVINTLNLAKRMQFEQTRQTRNIGNSSEWIEACYAYMDDLFMFASSQQQAEMLIEVAEEELNKLHMKLNYSKCKALWVRNGLISQPKPHITTKYGQIDTTDYLEVLGAPITQKQEKREEYFTKVAEQILKVQDIASLMYMQNSMTITKYCTASKLVRLVQTTQIEDESIKQLDRRIRNKVGRNMELEEDAVKSILNMPIKLGGEGIPAVRDIKVPALVATQYELAQEPIIQEILKQAHLLNNGELTDNQGETTHLMGKKCEQTGRILEVMESWEEARNSLRQTNSKMSQHALWMHEKQKDYEYLQSMQEEIGEHLIRRINGAKGRFSGAHRRAIGANNVTKMDDETITTEMNDACLSTKREERIKSRVKRALGMRENEEIEKCIICGNNWRVGHITNCTCVQSTKTRRHTETKYQIAAIFKGLPDVQVELEPGAGH
ncbi:MAG: hypothetical protein EZS28_034639, partial [Streblomastix strix]